MFKNIAIPGVDSNIDMVYVYVPSFWSTFSQHYSIAIGGGGSSETKELKFKNLVYFMQIIYGQNWVLFYRKWYTDGWVMRRKIGIEKVRFSRFSITIVNTSLGHQFTHDQLKHTCQPTAFNSITPKKVPNSKLTKLFELKRQ